MEWKLNTFCDLYERLKTTRECVPFIEGQFSHQLRDGRRYADAAWNREILGQIKNYLCLALPDRPIKIFPNSPTQNFLSIPKLAKNEILTQYYTNMLYQRFCPIDGVNYIIFCHWNMDKFRNISHLFGQLWTFAPSQNIEPVWEDKKRWRTEV